MHPLKPSPRTANLVAAFLIMTASSAQALSACLKESPTHRVGLLELYTSEGCDSCPPANDWLGLQANKFDLDQVVPIVLHVDYWDYIGWKDRFASPAFGQRHRASVAANNARTAYTPHFFLSGKQTNDWRQNGALEQLVKLSNSQLSQAKIRLEASSTGREANVKVQFKTLTKMANSQGYIAVLEDKLISHITRGENAGATLKEGRVVRHWLGPYALDTNTDSSTTLIERKFLLPVDSVLKNLSLAAFVQNAATGVIVQAAGTKAGECF